MSFSRRSNEEIRRLIFNSRARKLINLRLFNNPENSKAWDKSVKDLDLEILCVSQVYACSDNFDMVITPYLFLFSSPFAMY